MVPTSEGRADLDELETEQLTHQIHGNLPGSRERFGPRLGAQSFRGDTPLLCHGLLNRVRVETNRGGSGGFAGTVGWW